MFGGRQLRSPAPTYRLDDQEHILAALIEAEKTDELPEGLKAIFVADIDLVHDVMFDVWQRQMYDLKIDNVLFVLNCVDYLAGDERFIELRKRRPEHRTLLTLERQKSVFEQRRSDEVRKAEEEAEEAVEQAKERLNAELEEIQKDMQSGKVDAGAMQVRLQNATEAENRKLAQTEKEIERKKNEQVRRVRIETEQEIRRIENGVWRWAILVPPLPAIILGITVLLSRLAGERQGIASDRMR